MSHPLFILAVLGLNVALSEWLARRTVLRNSLICSSTV